MPGPVAQEWREMACIESGKMGAEGNEFSEERSREMTEKLSEQAAQVEGYQRELQ